MKKRLAAMITTALVVGVASTTFAAANPFVDVPAKHWAYDAVTKLAQAGIVDGYNDGTFRGDKTITRYEMAQIVAKAMVKSDKADAAQKAALDKLAVEFSAELNNLGVRVAKLEANQSKVKFSGDVRMRYDNLDNAAAGEKWADRFRLNMDAQINDTTTMYARYVFADGALNDDNNPADAARKARLSDMALTTKGLIDNTNVTVGRYTLNMGPTTHFSGTTGDVEGIMTTTKVGKTTLMLGYADAADRLIKNGRNIENVQFAEATYTNGKAKVYADYFKNVENKAIVDEYDIIGGGLVYKFDKNVAVIGEYYQNSADTAKTFYGSDPSATIARVAYKGANAAVPKTFGAHIEYVKYEGNSMPYGFGGGNIKNNYADVGATKGLKSYDFQTTYVLAKNVTFDGIYQFDIKDAKTGVDANSKSYTRLQINYLF